MPLIDTITSLFNRNAKKYMYIPIDFSHVKDATYSAEPLEAGKNYFRLWLSEMCLAKDREWFKSLYPVVHSIIHIQFGNQEISLPYVAGSLNLSDVNSSNLDKVIQLNHPMTSLMPFNGGAVEVAAGILAMQGEDYLNRFIKVMGDFSSILVVPQLSTALNVAGPIAKGVEELLGVSNGDMHLGLHQSFVGKGGGSTNCLKAGYIAAILAEEEELDTNGLWVMNDRLRYGTSADDSEPLTGFTYMLFRIESREERDDMDGLTNISEPFNEAISALMNGEEERSKTLLRTCIAAAMTSPDLTKADRRRVAQVMKTEFDEAQNMVVPTRGEVRQIIPKEAREIDKITNLNKAMQRAISVEEALARGEPTFDEIFGIIGHTKARTPEKLEAPLTSKMELEKSEMFISRRVELEKLGIPVTRGEFTEELVASPKNNPEEIKTITRYPNLECPDKVVLGVKFSLLVELLKKPLKPDTKGIVIEDKGLPDQPPEVEIVVFAKGFDIEGSNTKVLQVDRDNDSDLVFFLIPEELGEQQIRVDFYLYGRRIGTERRNISVIEDQTVNDEEVKQPESSWALPLTSGPVCCPPDLEIRIILDRSNKILDFELYNECEYHFKKVGQVSLKAPPENLIKDWYDELNEMASQIEDDAEQRMAAIGNELWRELIPGELQHEYWRFKDHVKSVLITSDEPWIPWEMIKPYRDNDNTGEREDDPFWCLRFELSRWLAGPAPEGELPIGTARPVAPVQIDLAAINEEVKFIEQLSNLNSDITGLGAFNKKKQVLDFVKEGGFFVLHFASHCGFNTTSPNNSAIQLSGELLKPSDIQTSFKQPKPLIFINACEGAQMGFSFTGLGGWADRFIKIANAGAFAGAMWEVQDSLALKFAKSFYTSLLQEGKTIAQAFRIAREAVREADPSNSTWLAYVLYADPEAYMKKPV